MNDPTTDKDILILLGKIDGQLTSLLARFDSRNAEDDKKHARHEERLSALEKAKWIMMGASVAAGGGAATLFQLFGAG
jgi:hypothetical protein